jgi:tRNA(Ile)-lysidine synthase
VVVAHVVHDLRERERALADRDAVRELAGALGKRFVEREIAVRALAGNAEANARRGRYRALAELAREQECRYVAVAHQGDDQAETVLMRLMRGSGARGLGAMAEARPLEAGLLLIRPMLGIGRADSESLCRGAGWTWREDATNADTSRLRAAVRHEVLPVLRRLSPTVMERVGATAGLLRDAAGLIDERVMLLRILGRESSEGGSRVVAFDREALRAQPRAVTGELLRALAREVSSGRGGDGLTSRPVGAAVRAVRDGSTEPRVFRWREAEIRVTASEVSVVGSRGALGADLL